MKLQRPKRHAVLGILILLALGWAWLGSAAASGMDMAHEHWAAIAKNDLGMTNKDYEGDAVLQWVGGPLNGTYEGQPAIAGAWFKFFRAHGPLTVELSNVRMREDDERQIITALAIFKGKRTVPVDYTLVYDAGRLVSEIWKVRPSAADAGHESSKFPGTVSAAPRLIGAGETDLHVIHNQ